MKRGCGSRIMSRPQQIATSPLLATQLQGLKDIDMELELLKRKREIIEQQQQILSQNFRQRNDYEQAMYSESHEARYDDYSRSYEDSLDSYGGGLAPSRKRHIPVWDNETPPKRFSGPVREDVRQTFGSRLGPPPNNRSRPIISLFDCNVSRPAAAKTFRPRPTYSAPPQKKKDFNPTKVTKPSAAPAPANKLNTYQPAERKKLVNEAVNVSSNKAAPAKVVDDKWLLRSDREPSRQMSGRLELALGSLMKELPGDHAEYEHLFGLSAPKRAMKQLVRERIRTAMMGKLVTTSPEIKAIYRDMFPKETDIDIVMKGLEAHQTCEFIPMKSDDPEVYFKKNMNRLLSMKLDEMVHKLEEVYGGRKPNQVQPKFKQQEPTPIQLDTSQSNLPIENKESADLTQQSEGPAKEGEISTSDQGQGATDGAQSQTENVKEVKSDTGRKNEILDPQLSQMISTDKYKAFDRLMTYKLTHLLRKFVPKIIDVIDLDSMYNKAKTAILNEVRQKFGAPPIEPAAERRTLVPLQYYVKILGKPALPKRKAMESFFEKYQPKAIKKHRAVHNLLFVGFAEKEPFEKILAADGTVIGRYVLDIKVSEKIEKKNNNSVVTTTADDKPAEENPNQSSTSEDRLIGSNLDEQITDLLTSIRKAEEQDKASDDVVIIEPMVTENIVVKIENSDSNTSESQIVECDALNDANNDGNVKVENCEANVIETKDNGQPHVSQSNVQSQTGINSEVNTISEAAVNAQPESDTLSKDNSQSEVNIEPKNTENNAKTDETEIELEKADTVAALKTQAKDVKATPIRASARLMRRSSTSCNK